MTPLDRPIPSTTYALDPAPLYEQTWRRRILDRLFAAGPDSGDNPNPLAIGAFCPTCGTRLDKEGRECPMCGGGRR